MKTTEQPSCMRQTCTRPHHGRLGFLIKHPWERDQHSVVQRLQHRWGRDHYNAGLRLQGHLLREEFYRDGMLQDKASQRQAQRLLHYRARRAFSICPSSV
ncbi:hypothetical protein F444_23205 [Phytophthora nicotianae P1976]|uniref:Uncharacterized protein n=1 Tax=Phytophthora nicotianae P1976 TaxID=1317066 RepID=A0A080YVK7_PHYNI|nr:hypothetical protein F444_23205 [Phytophthora nicotianae P1976]